MSWCAALALALAIACASVEPNPIPARGFSSGVMPSDPNALVASVIVVGLREEYDGAAYIEFVLVNEGSKPARVAVAVERRVDRGWRELTYSIGAADPMKGTRVTELSPGERAARTWDSAELPLVPGEYRFRLDLLDLERPGTTRAAHSKSFTVRSNAEGFSPEEVEANVRRFSATVLEATTPPSLHDYARFQGVHRENEYEQELAHCIEVLGTTPVCTRVEPKLSDACERWWEGRPSSSRRARSLFYEELRRRVRVSPGSLQVRSQRLSKHQGAPIVEIGATVVVGGEEMSIEFWHWPDRRSADSLVGVLRYEGRDVEAEITADVGRRICPSGVPW